MPEPNRLRAGDAPFRNSTGISHHHTAFHCPKGWDVGWSDRVDHSHRADAAGAGFRVVSPNRLDTDLQTLVCHRYMLVRWHVGAAQLHTTSTYDCGFGNFRRLRFNCRYDFHSNCSGGLIVYGVPEELKGKAAGGFQVGNTGGIGLGGGIGVWLAAHFSAPKTSCVVLALTSLACLAGLSMVPDATHSASGSVVRRIFGIGKELWDLVKQPRGALVAALVLTPIGVGAANNLWSAVADEWHVSANTIALVTGAAGACVAAAGCAIGGWWADRMDRRVVYLAGGGILALVGTVLAITPRNPVLFTAGTLSYTMTVGICNAAFSALILSTIGRGAAATKCAIIAAIGNLPVSYMTALDGWVHDRWGSVVMLVTEAAICVLLIVVTAFVLRSVPALRIVSPASQPALQVKVPAQRA